MHISILYSIYCMLLEIMLFTVVPKLFINSFYTLTLSPLAVNYEDRWWPLQTIWIQMKPHKVWGFIWDPNCLTFRLYISKKNRWKQWIFWNFWKKQIFEKLPSMQRVKAFPTFSLQSFPYSLSEMWYGFFLLSKFFVSLLNWVFTIDLKYRLQLFFAREVLSPVLYLESSNSCPQCWKTSIL